MRGKGNGLPFLLAAILGAGLPACTYSVHPLVEEAEAVFDPGLGGVWKDENGEEALRVWRGEGNTYEVVFWPEGSGSDRAYPLEARMTRIADCAYASFTGDLERAGCAFVACQDAEALGSLMLLRLHGFVRLERDGERLRIRTPDPSWFRTRFSEIPGFSQGEFDVILTGGTEDLREMVRVRGDEAGLWSEEDSWLVRDPAARPEPTRAQLRRWRWRSERRAR